MPSGRFADRLKASIDPVEAIFGTLPAITGLLAFSSWSSVIVRKLRGEEVKLGQELGSAVILTLFVFVRSVMSREYAHGAVALQHTVVDMHEVAHEAAEDAKQRDARAAEQTLRLTRLTKMLVWLAGLTLTAAVVTLVVAIISA